MNSSPFVSARIYALANVASSAIPFLLLPVLTRVLTPHEYGLVAVFTSVMAVLGALIGLSVHGAVNVRHFDPGVDQRSYVGSALGVLAASAMLGVAVVAVLASQLTEWTGLPLTWLIVATLASASQFVINIRLVLWQVTSQATRYAAFQVLQTAFNLCLSLMLVLYAGFGWEGRAVGVVAATLGFAAIGLLSLHRGGMLRWEVRGDHARDVLRFGLPLVPHALGSLFIAASDRVIVANVLSLRDAGIYAASMQVGLVIGILADAFSKAFTPWLYRNLSSSDPALRRTVVRYTYLCFATIGALSVAFGAAAPYLLQLLGEEFRSSGEVVFYIAIGGAFNGMYLLVVSYIFYVRRNEWLAAASLGVGLFNLGFTYLLVGRNGAVGAAQAYAISQLLLLLIVWLIAARLVPMPWLQGIRPFPNTSRT